MNFPIDRRLVLPALLALLGALALFYATPWGIGLTHDSIMYVSGARNLLAGRGMVTPSASGCFMPLVEWPPLYPVILAVPGVFGVDPLDAARGLGALIFAANIFLVGALIGRLHPRSVAMPALASLLSLISPEAWIIHLMGWSEPLFIFLFLVSVWAWISWVGKQDHWQLSILTLVTALAFLARYPAAAIMSAVVAGIYCFGKANLIQKGKAALIFVIGSLLPILLWMTRNLLVSGNVIGQYVSYHPAFGSYLGQTTKTIEGWLWPGTPIASIVSTAGAVGISWLWFSRRPHREKGSQVDTCLFFLAVFIFIYAVVLIWSSFWISVFTPYDSRLLAPVYFSVLLAVFLLLGERRQLMRHPVFTATMVGLMIMTTLCYLKKDHELIAGVRREGLGYAAPAWRYSQLAGKIKTLPDRVQIYTNIPEGAFFLTGRHAKAVPSKFHPETDQTNGLFTQETDAMAAELRAGRAVLAIFNRVHSRFFMPSEEELKRLIPLRLVDQAEDGNIYSI